MPPRPTLRPAVALAATLGLIVAGLSLFRPPPAPPAPAIQVLGYTNRAGLIARVAITNISDQPLALGGQCLVNYSPAAQPRFRQSIEVHTTSTLHLGPNEGFIQEVMVFPAPDDLWQFEIAAARDSGWLRILRSAENTIVAWLPAFGHRLTTRFYHGTSTPWRPVPSDPTADSTSIP